MPNDPTTTPWPVRLPTDLLRRWRALAASRGMTAAGLVRQLMVRELDGDTAAVGLSPRAAGAKTGKLSLTLAAEDIDRVRLMATTEGHSLASWVANLIEARVKQQPFYTAQEAQVLSELRWRLPSRIDLSALDDWIKPVPPPTVELLEQVLAQLQQMHVLASERMRQLEEQT